MFEHYSYDSRDYAGENLRIWGWIAEGAMENGLGKLPMHRVICPECQGRGAYVNPNIDRHGLSANDMDDDQWEMYRTGGYDVTCGYCKGNNVVEEYDGEAASPELRKYVDEYWSGVYDDRQERIAELNAGC